MQAHRVETTVLSDGKLVIHDLPFQVGDAVEVIILPIQKPRLQDQEYHPLKGTVLEYLKSNRAGSP